MNQNRLDEERFPTADEELTPPHGDELRSDQTFGRTDRYSNVDDNVATNTEEAPPTLTGETVGGAHSDVIGRGGETIVNDGIAEEQPAEGTDAEDVDRWAP